MRHKLEQAGLADQVLLDSAGTGDWHVGRAPDARTQEAAAKRGYDLSTLRARQVNRGDFKEFDLILAMDKSNLANLKALQPSGSHAVLDLFLKRYDGAVDEVPDPYYGGVEGFEEVLDLVEHACDALLLEVKKSL